MARARLVVVLAAFPLAALAAQQNAAPQKAMPRAPAVVVIEMIDGGPYGMTFKPVRVTARLGDTLRYVQRGRAPHNVVFRSAPAGAELSALGDLREGPLLAQVGATYDVPLDARFAPGRWVYVCAPHEVLGMAGTVTVEPASP
jgi:plastocyanin